PCSLIGTQETAAFFRPIPRKPPAPPPKRPPPPEPPPPPPKTIAKQPIELESMEEKQSYDLDPVKSFLSSKMTWQNTPTVSFDSPPLCILFPQQEHPFYKQLTEALQAKLEIKATLIPTENVTWDFLTFPNVKLILAPLTFVSEHSQLNHSFRHKPGHYERRYGNKILLPLPSLPKEANALNHFKRTLWNLILQHMQK
ncbi:MAG: hypothetical protein KDK65_00005, partial [Chlamydiia bacterium]|nr:hypothetical protein [Chlamydiia bacterium]